MSKYMTIASISKANREAKRFWFSYDTVRFFDSKIASGVFDGGSSEDYPMGTRLWIESTRTAHDDGTREFKVVRFNVETHDIMYVSDGDYNTFVFTNREDANNLLRDMLHTPSTTVVEDWHGKATS